MTYINPTSGLSHALDIQAALADMTRVTGRVAEIRRALTDRRLSDEEREDLQDEIQDLEDERADAMKRHLDAVLAQYFDSVAGTTTQAERDRMFALMHGALDDPEVMLDQRWLDAGTLAHAFTYKPRTPAEYKEALLLVLHDDMKRRERRMGAEVRPTLAAAKADKTYAEYVVLDRRPPERSRTSGEELIRTASWPKAREVAEETGNRVDIERHTRRAGGITAVGDRGVPRLGSEVVGPMWQPPLPGSDLARRAISQAVADEARLAREERFALSDSQKARRRKKAAKAAKRRRR